MSEYTEWVDKLDSIAEKHGLLLSTELINFAEDVLALEKAGVKNPYIFDTKTDKIEWMGPVSLSKLPHHMMSCYANKTGRESDCNCADWGDWRTL